MPQVELEVRDIPTGQRKIACFETQSDARTWLSARPSMVEVLRVVNAESVGEAAESDLRAVMRPLSPEEVAAKDTRYREEMAQIRRETETLNRKLQAEHAHESGDPGRKMTVVWTKTDGLRQADPHDTRTIPAIVAEAVQAWIAERNEWLHPRRRHVAGAMLEVWPADVPEGHDRVEPGGQCEELPGWPE